MNWKVLTSIIFLVLVFLVSLMLMIIGLSVGLNGLVVITTTIVAIYLVVTIYLAAIQVGNYLENNF